MFLFLALTLVSSASAGDATALKDILKSPKATLKLYTDFKSKQHLLFGGAEDRSRFRLFRKSVGYVVELNEHDKAATYGINFFSSMTSDEKLQYLGLNITGHEVDPPQSYYQAPAGLGAPVKKLWTNEGAVTAVQNQGKCGSCWTYGAVGGLETRYKTGSGKLRKFAEQEYLDCTYSSVRDGCRGGWPNDAYTYSNKQGGRLASAANYGYTAKDGNCQAGSKPDAMVAYKIRGFQGVGKSEAATIAALATGSLSVAFEVTSKFQQYKSGILRDTSCRGRPNHAVTAVGYTSTFILVKNSWSTSWGDRGFVKFTRNYANCGLYSYSSFPKLATTGSSDTGPNDSATDYRPSEDDIVPPTPKPDCRDLIPCNQWSCLWGDASKHWCKKTCNAC